MFDHCDGVKHRVCSDSERAGAVTAGGQCIAQFVTNSGQNVETTLICNTGINEF